MAEKSLGSRSTTAEVLAGVDLKGKNIVVTGANTGIGFEAARAMAAAGAEVILACRSIEKADEAVARIRQRHPDADAQGSALDLASVASIRQFCEQIPFETIDVLVCNAGLVPSRYQETEEGIESCVGVCHFGHFVLCKLLLHKLLQSNEARVVMVSSESHRSPARLDFDHFPLTEATFSSLKAYGQAKLCNVLFANELQRRYGAQGLNACSLHPGALITTDIGRYSGVLGMLVRLVSPFTKNPDQGAATTVYCAARATTEEIQGSYFSHCTKVGSSKEANNAEVASRLWALSEDFCGSHGVTDQADDSQRTSTPA
jgi:NAD(P)-dependent dehydrogenase (short-subunit alcohol dehydrogenase family)